MKNLIFILSCVFLTSCYTSKQTEIAMRNCFMEKPYSEFLSAMGQPTYEYEDGKGGRILEWEQTSKFTTLSYSRTTTTKSGNSNTLGNYNVYGNNIYGQENTNTRNTTRSNTTTRPSRTYTVVHYIRLSVDEDGIIYRVSWYLSRNELYNFTKKWYNPKK